MKGESIAGSEGGVVLRAEGVAHRYGGVPVLTRAAIEVRARDVVGIRGRSGAGKSTFARILAGIEAPSEGTVWRAGPVGIVFQDPAGAFNPRVSVLRSIAEASEGFGALRRSAVLATESVRTALDAVGLARADVRRRPAALSGGQLQRAAIARALASGVALIVMDEPLASLDPLVRARITNLIADLRRSRNRSYVIVSHDDRLLEYVCDRIITMREGETWEHDG